MKQKRHDIACRRHLLQEKINAQRIEVAEISLQLQKPLALVDTGINAVHFIRRHPALVSGGMALLLALRRGNLALMAQEGWRLLCLYPATAYLARQLSRQKRGSGFD
jgi:hypothetical protein